MREIMRAHYRIIPRSLAEWLACRRAWVQIAVATLSGNSLRQTAPSSEIGSSLLRVAEVTAGLAQSNGSLPPGL